MKFEHQEYQEQCVKNIVSVLEKYDFDCDGIRELKSNLKKFYSDTSFPIELQNISNKFKKLDVLMETGTGKTFVYLKTIFELNKKFGLNKFVIFVPRKAIREGVLQNIDLTKKFFYSDDGYKKYIEIYTFDGKVSSINGFIRNKEELSVLVLTNSSIDKEKNVLRKKDNDSFYNSSMLDEIVKTNSIIILDEPHLLKGSEFAKIFLETFKNNLYIRFGATFPIDEDNKLANAVYVLDSITSFQKYLVKGIQIDTIDTHGEDFKIKEIKNKQVHIIYYTNGNPFKAVLKINDDIGQLTGLNQYNGIQIVNTKNNKIFLSNGTEKAISNDYQLTDEEIEIMIGKTIRIHFEKEEELFDKNIKELSLFFIPNVACFRGENPKVKNIFERKYREIRKEFYDKTNNKEYKKYLDKDFDEKGKLLVFDGYFSGDNGKNENKEFDGVELILKQKEKLLSFKEPLRFVFSVWALQEGWDNPNIFNICKLSNNNSDISRRQQVGRGLRLCVNQDGQRITFDYLNQDEGDFYKINTLDVIVSGYEKMFIEEIQKEIIDNSYCICGNYLERGMFERLGFNEREINKLYSLLEDNKIIEFTENAYKINKEKSLNKFIKDNKEKLIEFLDDKKYCLLLEKTSSDIDKFVKDGNKFKQKVKIRENKLQDFKQLWESINRKSKIIYEDLEEDELTDIISKKFNEEIIEPMKIVFEKKKYNAQNNEIEKVSIENIGNVDFFKDKKKYNDYIMYFVQNYTYDFIIKLFNKLDLNKIRGNPKKSMDTLENIIKEEIHANIINKISYNIGNEVIIGNKLQNKDGSYKMSLVYTELGNKILDGESKENYLFNKVVYDSDIEKDVILNEYNEVNGRKITVFAKLPKISIPTPYKTYNPDFAYLIENKNRKKLFLIVETKGYNKESDIPVDEIKKIEYAKKFFIELQKKLPEVEVKYEIRINKQDLANLIG